MYSDEDSDEDYTPQGSYNENRSCLRVLDDELSLFKRSVRNEIIKDSAFSGESRSLTDKYAMRKARDDPKTSWMDWRPLRIRRVFKELEGFHLGNLDLSGRSGSRYFNLARRLTPFLEDFSKLVPYVETVPEQYREWDFQTKKPVMATRSVSVLNRPDLWDPFCAKWNVPHKMFGDLLRWYTDAGQVFSTHPTPILQKLYITSLPSELLLDIFDNLSIDDARAFSATCKFMRELGSKVIFLTRRLVMECSEASRSNLLGILDEAELNKAMHKLMVQQREACVQNAQFLISRPDICARVFTLTIGNAWLSGRFENTRLADAFVPPTNREVFGPLERQFVSLLRFLHLTCLTMFNLLIDPELLSEIARQPLSSLTVSLCLASFALQRHILTTPISSTIVALTMTIYPDDTLSPEGDLGRDIWCILAACPNLRQLHVINFLDYTRGYLPPKPRFWSRLSALNHLERVCFDGVDFDISSLTEMFIHAIGRGPLRITHLKLYSSFAIEDASVLELLQVLHTGKAPLRVLAVEGVWPLSIGLFDGIATLFPELDALTLVRRDSLRQSVTKECRWPLPMYEYAARLRLFTCLRYFAANFSVDFLEQSTRTMLIFEDVLLPQTSDEESKLIRALECSFVLDSRSIVMPFAVHCPMLEVFTIMSRMQRRQFMISRHPNGTVDVDFMWGRKLRDEAEWNPTSGSTFPFPPQTTA